MSCSTRPPRARGVGVRSRVRWANGALPDTHASATSGLKAVCTRAASRGSRWSARCKWRLSRPRGVGAARGQGTYLANCTLEGDNYMIAQQARATCSRPADGARRECKAAASAGSRQAEALARRTSIGSLRRRTSSMRRCSRWRFAHAGPAARCDRCHGRGERPRLPVRHRSRPAAASLSDVHGSRCGACRVRAAAAAVGRSRDGEAAPASRAKRALPREGGCARMNSRLGWSARAAYERVKLRKGGQIRRSRRASRARRRRGGGGRSRRLDNGRVWRCGTWSARATAEAHAADARVALPRPQAHRRRRAPCPPRLADAARDPRQRAALIRAPTAKERQRSRLPARGPRGGDAPRRAAAARPSCVRSAMRWSTWGRGRRDHSRALAAPTYHDPYGR